MTELDVPSKETLHMAESISTVPRRILVAGATGYLGGFVAREFASRGHFVRAVARSPEKLASMHEQLDEIVRAEITLPETLRSVCDGIDIVFSSIGITRQKDGLSFQDVDYQGNKNLLEVAQSVGVDKFLYVSAVDGPTLTHLDIVKAHEDFVATLMASGMNYAILRPTGYFSDVSTLFHMAERGRVFLFGPGRHRTNPIHGADLAAVCADAIDGERQEIDVGGPEVLSWREVAELAFACLGKPPKISSIPLWLIRTVVNTSRVFNRHRGELLAFFTEMSTRDVVAPSYGTHTLADHFEQLARQRMAKSRVA